MMLKKGNIWISTADILRVKTGVWPVGEPPVNTPQMRVLILGEDRQPAWIEKNFDTLVQAEERARQLVCLINRPYAVEEMTLD